MTTTDRTNGLKITVSNDYLITLIIYSYFCRRQQKVKKEVNNTMTTLKSYKFDVAIESPALALIQALKTKAAQNAFLQWHDLTKLILKYNERKHTCWIESTRTISPKRLMRIFGKQYIDNIQELTMYIVPLQYDLFISRSKRIRLFRYKQTKSPYLNTPKKNDDLKSE